MAGDTVQVLSGTYVENIDFKGKDIVVLGAGPETTTIDGNRAGSCVTFRNGESRAAVLEGFRITRGEYSGGGGILIIDAEPTIRANRIVGNTANIEGSGQGGGVLVNVTASSSKPFSPLLEENVIENNQAGANGGGLYVTHISSPIVVRNRIEYNRCWRGDGGGVGSLLNPGGHVVLMENVIKGNRAGDHGGGALAARGSWEIAWNIIALNEADAQGSTGNSGGGIAAGGGTTLIHHNTIVMNRGDVGNPGDGITVESVGFGETTIQQNIIAHGRFGAGISCVGATPTVRDNLFWTPRGEEDVGCGVDWVSAGNLVMDPLFCDLDGQDYTVAENSPALSHPSGPVGAYATRGCEAVSVKPTTWGALKARYRSPGSE